MAEQVLRLPTYYDDHEAPVAVRNSFDHITPGVFHAGLNDLNRHYQPHNSVDNFLHPDRYKDFEVGDDVTSYERHHVETSHNAEYERTPSYNPSAPVFPGLEDREMHVEPVLAQPKKMILTGETSRFRSPSNDYHEAVCCQCCGISVGQCCCMSPTGLYGNEHSTQSGAISCGHCCGMNCNQCCGTEATLCCVNQFHTNPSQQSGSSNNMRCCCLTCEVSDNERINGGSGSNMIQCCSKERCGMCPDPCCGLLSNYCCTSPSGRRGERLPQSTWWDECLAEDCCGPSPSRCCFFWFCTPDTLLLGFKILMGFLLLAIALGIGVGIGTGRLSGNSGMAMGNNSTNSPVLGNSSAGLTTARPTLSTGRFTYGSSTGTGTRATSMIRSTTATTRLTGSTTRQTGSATRQTTGQTTRQTTGQTTGQTTVRFI